MSNPPAGSPTAQNIALGNVTAEDGRDRCWCGSKYWEGDRCVDCGTHVLRIPARERRPDSTERTTTMPDTERTPLDAPLADGHRRAPMHGGPISTWTTRDGDPAKLLRGVTGMSGEQARRVAARASLNGAAQFTTRTEVVLDGLPLRRRGQDVTGVADWRLSRDGREYTLGLTRRGQ